jgi:hypothetical protein
MKSTKRQTASRANGRLSRGPITEEGKRKASLNGLRHGFLSDLIVLPGESAESFKALLKQYVDKLAPIDGVEFSYVEELAASFWRLRRLWGVENRLWTDAIAEHPNADPLGQIADGFRDLVRQPDLALLQRYEARLGRAHQRALNNLFLLTDSNCDANLIPHNPLENKPADTTSSEPHPPAPPDVTGPPPPANTACDANEPADPSPADPTPADQNSPQPLPASSSPAQLGNTDCDANPDSDNCPEIKPVDTTSPEPNLPESEPPESEPPESEPVETCPAKPANTACNATAPAGLTSPDQNNPADPSPIPSSCRNRTNTDCDANLDPDNPLDVNSIHPIPPVENLPGPPPDATDNPYPGHIVLCYLPRN